MWDRLLVDCNIATMDPAVEAPFGAIENGAVGIQDGRIVRVGRRTELAGYQARQVEPLGGAWITPGLVDCHTHLVFGGNRADEYERRLEGATYEEIARAGGGIAATVKATRAASLDELVEAVAAAAPGADGGRRHHGRDQVRLWPRHRDRVEDAAGRQGARRERGGADRADPAGAACAAGRIRRAPRGVSSGWRSSRCSRPPRTRAWRARSTPFARASASRRDEVRALFEAASDHGLAVKLHAEQLSNLHGAALAADYGALSADHLEHADEAGVAAMARAGMVAVLLPGAFYALRETQQPPVDAAAPLRRADGGGDRLQSGHLAGAVADADAVDGLHPVRPDPEESLAGMTREGARALGLQDEVGTLSAGKAADLCIWRIGRPAELCYWIGLRDPNGGSWPARIE